MKSLGSIVIRLAMLAGMAWYFLPAWVLPKPIMSAKPGPEDFLQWKYCNDSNPEITQSLTVYGNGRSSVMIVRPKGDRDLPEGGGWQVRCNPETDYMELTKTNLVSMETAKRLFDQAIENGVLDLITEPSLKEERLEVRISTEGTQQVSTGPLNFATCFHWNRNAWINRLRWKKIIRMVQDESGVYDFLKRKEIILVNE